MTYGFVQFDAESVFVKRLREHGADVWTGLTTPEIRAERIRTVILGRSLSQKRYSLKGDKIETFAQAFERVFSEPLIPKLL